MTSYLILVPKHFLSYKVAMDMKLVVVVDTFLKVLPDPISRFKASKLPNQVVLLKKGTALEIYDYALAKGSKTHKVGDYIVVRLAAPPKLTGHQNLCWFIKRAHVVIRGGQLRDDSVSEQGAYTSYKQINAQKKPERANPMDSSGGLVVSPPVTVQGQYYPFGRIAYSSCALADRVERSPQTTELNQFFKSQNIQSPFALHTDWLIVDRVDEIVSFLPADNEKGFQVLVASPLSARIILQGLNNSGFTDTVMFQGVKRANYNNLPGTAQKAEISVGDLLQDATFWSANQRYQSYMNENIETLKVALDIGDSHLLNIPVLFHPPFKSRRTASYFPNMVNHCVLDGNRLLAPQPKGPIINGKCAFETAFEYAIPSREVVFEKARYSQHSWQGECSLWA